MTEEENILAGSGYDPRYEIVDLCDYAWWSRDGFSERFRRAYEAGVISLDEYNYTLEEEPLDEESTTRCHEIMVKMGLLRRIPQA